MATSSRLESAILSPATRPQRPAMDVRTWRRRSRLRRHRVPLFGPLARKEQTMATKAAKYKVNSCPICSISLETFEGPKSVFYNNVCLFDLGFGIFDLMYALCHYTYF